MRNSSVISNRLRINLEFGLSMFGLNGTHLWPYSHWTRSNGRSNKRRKLPCSSNSSMHTACNHAMRNTMSWAWLGRAPFLHITLIADDSVYIGDLSYFGKELQKWSPGDVEGSCRMCDKSASKVKNSSWCFASCFNIFLWRRSKMYQSNCSRCTQWTLCMVCLVKGSFMCKCRSSRHTLTNFWGTSGCHSTSTLSLWTEYRTTGI